MTQEQIDDLARQLKETLMRSGLSLNEIERRSGVSHAVLSRFMRGERTLTLPLASKLCQLLGLRLMSTEVADSQTDAEPSPPVKRSTGDQVESKPQGRRRKADAAPSEPTPVKKSRKRKG